ncbi:hypothetical protein GM3708_193 [Geminocystis sp. NIES-3708]|uniref:SH3 domain-containing protein n=1 Tax=Geminocystis sp. NIES-3708 TaxID=1615909 RepID=UPI0005FC4B54|nr:SH3 domain-containing protein [Geminocystis sp. NIES-3708]BAQ59788.1 hypothetical protein GM3708_193 [Geminocystis sp. NIES-3708]
MNKKLPSTIKTLLGLSVTFCSLTIPLESKLSSVSAQNSQAVIYAPPSNVRATPNGQILCSIKTVTAIDTYGYSNGWYITDVCGKNGYIHESQIRFQSTSQSSSSSGNCSVINIKTGQLAVRKSPDGESIAGLNNNNIVQYIKGDFPWYYIKVINGPNSRVNGKTGWVNANYLNCY